MKLNALEVLGLEKTYANFALKNVSFSVPKGSIVGLVGPNGAGKTTIIKSILNMVRYNAGSISIFGTPNNTDRNQKLGIVSDDSFYDAEWRVEEINKIIRPFYREWNQSDFDNYLKRFNIGKNKKVSELSKGMNIKLMLAVALSHSAQLLILDEPTSGLDPVARDEICEILNDYVRHGERSVLFSTHIISDLEKIADEITFILNGAVVFSEDKDDLTSKFSLVKGDPASISETTKAKIIGFRVQFNEFIGLVRASDKVQFPVNVKWERATLDDIVVFMSKEGN